MSDSHSNCTRMLYKATEFITPVQSESRYGPVTMRFLILSVVLLATSVLCDRNDFIENSKLARRYRLMYNAETWQDAKRVCADEDRGKLAVPKSQSEFQEIQSLVRKMHYPSVRGCTGSVLLAWLGISNVDDYTVWRNVDGEDIESTGFSTWASGNGAKNSSPKEPHCVVVDAANPGLRSFWCHHKQPFVCEYEIDGSRTDPVRESSTTPV